MLSSRRKPLRPDVGSGPPTRMRTSTPRLAARPSPDEVVVRREVGVGDVQLLPGPGDREGVRVSVRRDGPAGIRQPGKVRHRAEAPEFRPQNWFEDGVVSSSRDT